MKPNISDMIIKPRASDTVLLRTQRAQVGDVILSLGPTLPSTGIAKATRGPFSHAALWNGSLLYEAMVARGIGPLSLRSVVRQFAHQSLRQHAPIEDLAGLVELPRARKYLYLRHPRVLDEFGRLELEDLMVSIEFLKQFPEPVALVEASAFSRETKLMLKHVLPMVQRFVSGKQQNPGVFCSQLVAMFFREAGVPLFKPDRPPELVSPNTLLESLLEPQSDVLMCLPAEEVVDPPSDVHADGLHERLSPARLKAKVKRQAKIQKLLKQQQELMENPPSTPLAQSRRWDKWLSISQEIRALNLEIEKEIDASTRATQEMLKAYSEDPELRDAVERFTRPFSVSMQVVELKGRGQQGAPLHESPTRASKILRHVATGTQVLTHAQAGDRWQVQLPDGTEGYMPRHMIKMMHS